MTTESSIAMANRIEHWPLEDLVPYSRNARTHSEEQVDKIAASIAEFGFTAPILVDVNAGILAGHGRLAAARKLDMSHVPVIQLDHLSEVQRRAYLLADNRIALDAGWDTALLAGEIARLEEDGFDLALTGFDDKEIAELLAEQPGEAGTGDADAAPAVDEVHAVTRPEDLWILGSHKLLCGDATSIQALEFLMAGDRAACAWTDPPYNVEYVGKTPDALTISNDAMDGEDFYEFLRSAFSALCAVLAPGAAAYIAHAETEGISFRRAFIESGFHFASCLIWRKNTLVLGHSDYHYQHEPILYGWRGDGSHRYYGGRDKTTIQELGDPILTQIGDEQWQITLGEQTFIIRGKDLTVQPVHGTVFFEEKPSRSSDHPTMKPVALIERMINNSSKRGDIVIDPFGGSGSTLIACERLKRRARLTELEPRYCDVIVKRWQEYSGQEATLQRTGRTFDVTAMERGL